MTCSSFLHRYSRSRCATNGEPQESIQCGIHPGRFQLHGEGIEGRDRRREYRIVVRRHPCSSLYIQCASPGVLGPKESPKLALRALPLSTERSPCGLSFLNRFLQLYRLLHCERHRYSGQSTGRTSQVHFLR